VEFNNATLMASSVRGRSRQSRRAKPKPAAPATSQPKREERAERAEFFENNRIYLNRKYRVSGGSQATTNRSRSSGNVSFKSDNNAYLDDYELVGDDFFLSLKKFELVQQFERGGPIHIMRRKVIVNIVARH
jgi:hypothetical protein